MPVNNPRNTEAADPQQTLRVADISSKPKTRHDPVAEFSKVVLVADFRHDHLQIFGLAMMMKMVGSEKFL